MMAMFVGDIMSKINIKVTIKNKESDISYETKGILLNNELKYYEENNTKVVFNYDNNHLIRTNDELRMDFTFDLKKKTKGKIEIEELDKELEVEINTKRIERQDNNILLDYSIDEDKFIYRIEVIK